MRRFFVSTTTRHFPAALGGVTGADRERVVRYDDFAGLGGVWGWDTIDVCDHIFRILNWLCILIVR